MSCTWFYFSVGPTFQWTATSSEVIFSVHHPLATRVDATVYSDLDVLEVFSRGQNPQHWHLSRRGLGTDKEGNALSGEVFMEIARKESTLSDVDNELAGVMRRFLE